jgi:ribosome biogenesis protein MAK21
MTPDKEKHRRGRNERHGQKGFHSSEGARETDYKPHTSFLVSLDEDSPTWYECGKQIPGRNDTIFSVELSSSQSKNTSLANKYRALADEIHRVELGLLDSSSGKASADERWVEKTMKKGTLKDRIAASSVVVSTDPLHKLSTLDTLLNDSRQPNSRVAQMAAEALEDIFLNTLLPPDRKLWALEQRPLALYDDSPKKTLSPRVLLLWRYEEMVKERYHAFLNGYMAPTLKDGMLMNKIFAIRMTGNLLRSCVEGESQLLSMLVNKLGDPEKKVASAAGHELRRVLDQHENMQNIIAREVQQLAHRPHLSPRALYNCIVFLNQLKLRPEKRSSTASLPLPVSLVNTYFRMFDIAMKQSDQSGGMKSRLMSALLTGINRAHPFLIGKDQELEDHMDSLYKIVHTAPPAASTQALLVLFHVTVGVRQEEMSEAQQKTQDRFYRAVYAKLSQSSFLTRGRHLTMFFNLLFKSMKNDTNGTRVIAFSKRLACTVLHSSPPIVAASIFLLNEVMKTHGDLLRCLDCIPDSEAQVEFDHGRREPRSAIFLEPNGLSESVTLTSPSESTTFIPPMWEWCLSSHHFHPSVTKFAESVGAIEYSGDPLRDFSLAPFLDKFAYRNPKLPDKRKHGVAGRRIKSHMEQQPINDPSFLETKDIKEEDKFFHAFFLERARRDEIKGLTRGKASKDKDEQDAQDEAFNMMEQHQIDSVFDDGFDTDPEEEEFVHSLAVNLMKGHSGHAADFDDEDPDMEDWDDLHGDETGPDHCVVVGEPNEKDESPTEDESTGADFNDGEDADAFMDEMDSSADEEEILAVQEIEKAFSGAPANANAKRQRNDVFADAEDYEELIKRSYEEGKAAAKETKTKKSKKNSKRRIA